MVCSSAMSFNLIQLFLAANQLLCSCVNETTLFSFLRSLLGENGRSLQFPKIFLQKQTPWSNNKTIIELGYRKISWFVMPLCRRSTRHWQITIFCSTLSNNCYITIPTSGEKLIGPVGYNLSPRAIHATSCIWPRGCIKENFKRSKKLLNILILKLLLI